MRKSDNSCIGRVERERAREKGGGCSKVFIYLFVMDCLNLIFWYKNGV